MRGVQRPSGARAGGTLQRTVEPLREPGNHAPATRLGVNVVLRARALVRPRRAHIDDGVTANGLARAAATAKREELHLRLFGDARNAAECRGAGGRRRL